MRRLAALVVALVLAAGCASDDEAVLDLPGTDEPPAPSTTAPGGGPDGASPPPTQATDGAARQEPTSTTATTGPAAPADDGSAPIAAAARGQVGAFARTLLQASGARRIVLEVQHHDGVGPRPETMAAAREALGQPSGKQVEVTSVRLGGGSRAWPADELRRLADEAGRARQGAGGTAVVRLLWLRGSLAEQPEALGAAIRGDIAVVFPDRLDEATSPLVTRSRIEHSVTVHELGHLLGLVDLVLSTGRQDPDHPGHSRNRDSVMYWAVESTLVGQILAGPPPTSFDEADRRDLATIRSGG